MRSSSISKVLLVIIPLTIVVGGWFFLNKPVSTIDSPTSAPQEVSNQSEASISESSGIQDYSIDTGSASSTQHDNTSVVSELENLQPTKENNPTFFDNEASTIGLEVLSDAQFNELQSRLRNEPDLLQALLTEFRFNTDPERAKRIAALLGDLNSTAIINAAKEMVYSGNPASQHIGLDLLSRLQPRNNEARDIAIELLSSETNHELLVSTMNVLATPVPAASDQQRVQLVDNLNLLSSHPDPVVRSHSMTLLGRWNPGGASKTILAAGLTDQDPAVRATSTAAFIGKNNVDASAIYGLLAVAENSNEVKTTRQSALYALQKMQLPPDVQARYEQAVITVRRTRQ